MAFKRLIVLNLHNLPEEKVLQKLREYGFRYNWNPGQSQSRIRERNYYYLKINLFYQNSQYEKSFW